MREKIDENITTLPKAEAEADWASLSQQIDYLPFEYLSEMVEYYYLTTTHMAQEHHHHSTVIYYHHQPVALWPLWGVKSQQTWQLLNHGYPKILPPLIIPSISDKIRKKITKWSLEKVGTLARNYGLHEWHASQIMRQAALPLWHRLLMEQGATLSARHTMMIDVSRPLCEIKAGFRKSYKSLVNTLPDGWNIACINQPNGEDMERFRQFHAHVSGRETRTIDSWELQRKLCCHGHGFIIFLEQNQTLIGASMFIHTAQEGYYGVGVYERSMFDQPIGHVIQMEAIRQLQTRGVTHYRIGERYYPTDFPAPSSKEIDISFFKEGFGAQHYLIMDYCIPTR